MSESGGRGKGGTALSGPGASHPCAGLLIRQPAAVRSTSGDRVRSARNSYFTRFPDFSFPRVAGGGGEEAGAGGGWGRREPSNSNGPRGSILP
jgi:hypothetical protein